MAQVNKKKQQSNPSKQPQNKRSSKTVVKSPSRNYLFALFGIAVLTFLIYLPALKNGFVWDDEFYILDNSTIHAFNLKEMFSQYYMGNYHPLTILSYAVEYHLWGFSAKGYHIVNIVLHVCNTILVFYVINRLSNKIEVALIASLLFGIHPMHVESVAWAAERKDLLYTFFFLSSYLCYIKYLKDKSKRFYFFCLLLFVFSLLSKAMAASLPVLLLLTDYFIEGKIKAKQWLEKTPFFILSLLFGVVAVFAQKSHHAVADISTFTLVPRIVFAAYGFVEYIFKLLLPIGLSAYYPYPVKGGDVVPVLYYIYPVVLATLIVSVFISLRTTKKLLFGVGFFAITVFLVLQFLPVGDAIMADRYSYIPSIGIFYLLAEGLNWVWAKRRNLKVPAIVLVVLITGFLSFKTYARCTVWKDGMSLWTDVISHDQTVPAAYSNRGKILLEQKHYDEALSDFNKTVELDPNFANVYNNRGALLMDLNRFDESKKDFDKALQLQPVYPYAYNNRGLLMVKMKRYEDAVNDYSKAIEQKPDFTDAYFNRGIALELQQKHDQALNDYNKVIELDPNYILVYNNRANILMAMQRYDEATADYDKAIALNPTASNNYLNKGTMFTNQKKYNEAISNYSKAIELDPNSGQAYYNRGIVEHSMGKDNLCCADLQLAVKFKYPDAEYAYNYYCH